MANSEDLKDFVTELLELHHDQAKLIMEYSGHRADCDLKPPECSCGYVKKISELGRKNFELSARLAVMMGLENNVTKN